MAVVQPRWPAGRPTGGQFKGKGSMPTGKFIESKAAGFYDSGGEIMAMDYAAKGAAHATLREMSQGVVGLEDDLGTKFTKNALDSEDGYIAVVDGVGVAGAIGTSKYDRGDFESMGFDEPTIYIEYLGSTNITKGTGAALVEKVMRDASDGGYGIALTPSDGNAASFWKAMGMKEQEEGMTMSASRVDYLVGQMRG